MISFLSTTIPTKHMELNQLTDTQLIDRINYLGEEILATSEHDHYYEITCARYDAVREELDSRGLW